MIVANSSPLIALSRLDRLDILEALFGKVNIPNVVRQETVLETTVENQRESISKSINSYLIIVVEPTFEYRFKRKLHSGEKAVLSLGLQRSFSCHLGRISMPGWAPDNNENSLFPW